MSFLRVRNFFLTHGVSVGRRRLKEVVCPSLGGTAKMAENIPDLKSIASVPFDMIYRQFPKIICECVPSHSRPSFNFEQGTRVMIVISVSTCLPHQTPWEHTRRKQIYWTVAGPHMVDRVRIAAPLELWRDSNFPVSFTAEAFCRDCAAIRVHGTK